MIDVTHKFRVGDEVVVVESLRNQPIVHACSVSRVSGQDVSVRLDGKHYHTFRGPDRACVGCHYGYAPELRTTEEHAAIPAFLKAKRLAWEMGEGSYNFPLTRAAAFLEALERAKAIAEGKSE